MRETSGRHGQRFERRRRARVRPAAAALVALVTVGASACAPPATPAIVVGSCTWVEEDFTTPAPNVVAGHRWYLSIGIQIRMDLTDVQSAIRSISPSLGAPEDMLVQVNTGGDWSDPAPPPVGYLNSPMAVPAGTEYLVRLAGRAGTEPGAAAARVVVFADQITGVYELDCAGSVVADPATATT